MKFQLPLSLLAGAALAIPIGDHAQSPEFQPGDFNVHTSVHSNASGYQPFQRDQDFSTPGAKDSYVFGAADPSIGSGQPGTVGEVTATGKSGEAHSDAHASDNGPVLLSNGSGTTVTTKFYLVPHSGYPYPVAPISVDYWLTGSVQVKCQSPCGQAEANMSGTVNPGFTAPDGTNLNFYYSESLNTNFTSKSAETPVSKSGSMAANLPFNQIFTIQSYSTAAAAADAITNPRTATGADASATMSYCVTVPGQVDIVWVDGLAPGCPAAALPPSPAADAGPGSVCDPTPSPNGQPAVCGFADTHIHQFANLGFGGLVLWGEAFNPNGIEAALPSCDFADVDAVFPSGGPVPRTPVFRNGSVQSLTWVHGVDGLGDLIGMTAGEQGFGHSVDGEPDFKGWPKWNTLTHQQVYVDWLYRAFQGGLKLIVMPAITNEVFCSGSNRRAGWTCDDMEAVDRQIAGAKALQDYIDGQYGSPGKGWYRIVTSPQKARDAIANNQLAVVLGIEVDGLFGCKAGSACTEDSVRQSIQKYYDLGVRHIFPVHVFDNDFAGSAVYMDAFDIGNAISTGSLFQLRDCSSEGYNFNLVGSTPLASWMDQLSPVPITTLAFGADCNAKGLTPLGQSLIQMLMAHKMIIDTDHMSKLAMGQTLDLAEANNYSLIGGHSWFLDISKGSKRSEMEKTSDDLQRIHRLGGMVSAILDQGKTSDINTYRTDIPHDCGKSSKSWAQAYLYAVAQTGGAGVGFGSDFNGFAGEPAPRFGDDACDHDQLAPQTGGVSYPFSVTGGNGQTMDKTAVGSKVFDINYDGLAHVGMYPDFIADLRSIGLSDNDLKPLFRSAEQYIEMWEKIEANAANPPSVTFSSPVPTNSMGWNKQNVPLTIAANQSTNGFPISTLTWSSSGAEALLPATVQPQAGGGAAFAAVTIFTEGSTTVTASALDTAGNTGGPTAFTVKLDKTPPTITGAPATPANANGWYNTNVTVNFSASDAISGVASINPVSKTIATEGAGQSASATASDYAGNSTSYTLGGINLDKTPPVITFANNSGTYTVDMTLNITCAASDALSGVASSTCPSALNPAYSYSLGTNSLRASATDKAGNTANLSATFAVIVNAASLGNLTTQFLTNKALGPAFNAKLQAIATAPDPNAKHGAVGAYINAVNAQMGKTLTAAQAAVLVNLVNAM